MRFNNFKIFFINKLAKFQKTSPKFRKLVLILFDLISILLAILISNYLVYFEVFSIINIDFLRLVMVSSIIGIPLYIFSYQYRSLSGYFTSELIYKFLARNFLLITLIYIVGKIFYLNFPDFRFWLVFFLINNFILIGIRLIIKDLIQFINHADNKYQPKVIIYGAGAAGAQLSGSINLSRNYQIEAFIDDNPSLWGRSLNSKKIISYNKIFEIKSKIKYIFLAIPSLDKIRKKEILNSLSKYKIPILEIPSIKELTSGKAQINSLRPIDLEDLLGRRAIYTNSKLVGNKIKNSVILVTGAGGSIGSELSKQIIAFNPKKLILLESNEFALYNLITELNELDLNKTEIVPVLGDAKNEILLNEIFDNNHIKVVFHAAAYKHVPLVEINALEGLLNNILSSYLICKISSEKSPTDIVLISSDKAVRPTNIMGASKRLSELIFKSFSKISCKNFSMVRFGNVIGSSGSVVPLFKKQIENGGPIKVTHKKIIRYFMTINEACGLVLQTIELSKGGDIFLLDMGEPKKIIDLAKQMILLSGLQVKDEQNPDGDIEIITTGLRPGEKLFEELLVDGKSEITSHPLIFRANEDSDLNDEFISNVNFLIELLEKRDKTNSLSLLSELIPDWVNNNT